LLLLAQGLAVQMFSTRSWLHRSHRLRADRGAQIESAVAGARQLEFAAALDQLAASSPTEVVLLTHRNAPDYAVMRRFLRGAEPTVRFRYAPSSSESGGFDASAVIIRSRLDGDPPGERVVRVSQTLERPVIDTARYSFELPARAVSDALAPQRASP
jgi:hypothetical protein